MRGAGSSASAIPAVEAASPRAGSTAKRRVLVAVGLAAALVLGAALAALWIDSAPADLSPYKFTPISRDEATKLYPVWSPDGKSIAYVALIHGIFQVTNGRFLAARTRRMLANIHG